MKFVDSFLRNPLEKKTTYKKQTQIYMSILLIYISTNIYHISTIIIVVIIIIIIIDDWQAKPLWSVLLKVRITRWTRQSVNIWINLFSLDLILSDDTV